MNLKKLSQAAKTLEEANAIIAEWVSLVEAQQLEIEALKADVEKLQNQRGRSSRNSSKPPSSDSPEQRHRRPKKPRSSRNKGAQPGHKKHQRTLMDEHDVDHLERYFPEVYCDCGGEIHAQDEPHLRHQVFDLPEVRYTVTEHQVYSGDCQRCGRKSIAAFPDWIPRGQMDAGLISTIALLSGQFHLSIRQIQAFLKEQWQLEFSLGAISQAQGKANPWLGAVYRQIGDAVRKSPVAHADETRHLRGSQTYWLWALVTQELSYFMVHYSRGKAAANELLGSFSGYLVTDHYAAYNDVSAERRQLCWAHLIRHFIQISERVGLAGDIGRRLLLISHAVFRTHHRLSQGLISHAVYQRRMKRLQASFERTLLRGSQLKVATRTANQCRHLLKDQSLCWTFLKHPDIALTNNTADRAIRPYVLWRKQSFASQSSQGDQFRPMILSIIGTAQRLGLSTATLLREICSQGLHQGEVSLRLPLAGALQPSV